MPTCVLFTLMLRGLNVRAAATRAEGALVDWRVGPPRRGREMVVLRQFAATVTQRTSTSERNWCGLESLPMAIPVLEGLSAASTDYRAAPLNLGVALARTGGPQKALERFAAAVRLRPAV